MSNLRRVLERQQKEREEIRCRRAEEDQDADEEEEQMLAVAVCMLNQSSQHRRPRAPNVDRRRESRVENLYKREYLRKPTPRDLQRLLQKPEARGFPGMIRSIDCMHWQWKNCPTAWQGDYGNRKGQKSIILEAVASFDTWVWHAFFGVAGSQNDLNVLGQSPVFDEVLRGHSPQVTYQINNTVYSGAYYLADGIYPRWTTFVKTIPNPQSEKERSFASFQEGYRKDVERCFGILQARWAIIRGAARMLDEDVLRGHSPQVTYQINNTVYSGAYYLADGIYPRWTTFVKTIPNPQSEKERSFAFFQEGYRKDVERCFGILQARWAIIRGAARMLDEEVLRSIMMTCIILHNMIVEDEYDYDAPEVFEPDPMNTALTRIYERPIGPNGLPLEPEPLLHDGRLNNPMIDRYQEMQSSYVHERRQVDLIEHLWQMKGNHNG
ncbi:hypothetical protein L3X38_038179 [Prunus dulcis]|uniref:Uncharacterized protein n=2 Tax=Prunus dulcis TaxID=3755 RepID=A0AAD4YR61_PRUDU|nr:hypothetical protein L3X38_038179 [Prunus dulcis]